MHTLARRSTRSAFGPLSPPRGATIAIVGVCAGASLLMSACGSLGSTYSEHRAMIVPHIDASPLSIENANGGIQAFEAERSDVSIRVDLFGHDLERLHFAVVHADRMGDETLRVWVEWPGGNRNSDEGATISIEIPDASSIDARTSNGQLILSGLSGRANLHSSNGAIRVERFDGSVFAETSNGAINAEHISGDIEMYTSNGQITATDAFGPIRAETSNGHIYVSTMDGNPGPVRLRTSNSRIDLDLGDGFEGVLKCQTSSGRIRVVGLDDARLIESSDREVELRVGQSEEVSAARTSNGSIRVRGRQAAP